MTTSHLVLLSWDIGAADGGLSRQAAGLAAHLAGRGHRLEVVTRLGQRPHRDAGVARVVDVAEAPPILPPDAGRLARALAFAPRATAVALQLAEDRRPDLVVAEGWQAGVAARSLRAILDVPVTLVLDGVEATRRAVGDRPDAEGEHVAALERAAAAAASTVFTRGPSPATVAAALDRADVAWLGLGAQATAAPLVVGDRDAGSVVAVLPPRGVGEDWATTMAARLPVRHRVLDLRFEPWPPAVPDLLVVHDIERGDVTVAALAVGIPVVVGPLAPLPDLVADGAGVVSERTSPTATSAVVRELLDDPERAVRLARAGRDRVARRHRWEDVAGRLLAGAGRPNGP